MNIWGFRSTIAVAKRIWPNSKGTSTIELAIVLPVGMALMLGSIDASMAFGEKLRVEAAAARVVEQISAYSRVQTNYTASVTEAATAAKVTASDVTATFWLECNNVVQVSYTAPCPNNSDQIARFVKIVIRGKFKPSINYGKILTTDASGFVRVEGDASVRVQ